MPNGRKRAMKKPPEAEKKLLGYQKALEVIKNYYIPMEGFELENVKKAVELEVLSKEAVAIFASAIETPEFKEYVEKWENHSKAIAEWQAKGEKGKEPKEPEKIFLGGLVGPKEGKTPSADQITAMKMLESVTVVTHETGETALHMGYAASTLSAKISLKEGGPLLLKKTEG